MHTFEIHITVLSSIQHFYSIHIFFSRVIGDIHERHFRVAECKLLHLLRDFDKKNVKIHLQKIKVCAINLYFVNDANICVCACTCCICALAIVYGTQMKRVYRHKCIQRRRCKRRYRGRCRRKCGRMH